MLQDEVKKAVEVMRAGGVILYPTDTVWGIGCDATNEEAVKKVFAIKKREDSKALICLVDSDVRLQRYVRNVADVTWDMIELSLLMLAVGLLLLVRTSFMQVILLFILKLTQNCLK